MALNIKSANQDLPGIVRMATLPPAKLKGDFYDIGSIEAGKLADFVVLRPQLDVQEVFFGAQKIDHGGGR